MTPTQFYLNVVLNGCIEGLFTGLAALAITLVYAVARFPNAATGDYMTFGAYTAKGLMAATGTGLLVATLGAMLAVAAVSLVFYAWMFRHLARRSHVAALVASIGVAMLMRNVMTLFTGHEPSVFPLPLTRAQNILGLLVQPTDLWLVASAIATLGAVLALLYASPIGRDMRAVADNPELARASGIPALQVDLALWTMVGIVAAIAGVLIGVKSAVQPELGWDFLLPGFTAAIVGGLGNPLGAVLAGLLVGLAQEAAALGVGHSYKIAMSFVILVAVLLWRPAGLLGRVEGVR